MKRLKHISGFTLIELSVVLVIIALLVGSGLSIAMGRLNILAEKETQAKLATIQEAISGYIRQTSPSPANRLPCPASTTAAETSSSFGRELGTPGDGNCTGSTSAPSTNGRAGAIPVRTLNLPDEYAYDGWGNKFTYVVDKRLTANGAFNTYLILTTADGGIGDIQVRDDSGASYRSSRIALLLISHGKNGYGAFARGSSTPTSQPATADQANGWSGASTLWSTTNATTFLVKAFYDGATTSEIYDDIVVMKARSQLRRNNE